MMHVVLGDGEMSRKELTETLKDLWERAGDESFWFVVQGKSQPTETDTNLVNWLTKNEIYFEVVTDDEDAMDEIYAEGQETHVVKRLGQKIVNLLNTKPEEGETADVLALFVEDDPTAEADRWLNNVIQLAMDAGFTAYGMNDGMVEIDLDGAASSNAPQEEEEEAVAPAKPTKRATKKAAAKPAEDGEEASPAPAKASSKSYTRDDLEEMELAELKEIASAKGIELPPRTRMGTYIDHILGETKDAAPSAEVETPPVTKTMSANGDDEENLGIDGLVDQVTAEVFKRIVTALS